MSDPSSAPVNVTQKALAAAWAVNQMSRQEWDNLCEKFIENASGADLVYPTAAAGGQALITHRNRPAPGNPLDGAEVGDLVFFAADATNQHAGHVGIYLGNGEMVSATPSGVKRSRVLSDPYYGPRFLGWGAPPQEWTGRASTPELVAGAQQLVTAAQGGTAQGGTPVADTPTTPTITALNTQIAALRDRITRNQQLLPAARIAVDYIAGPDKGLHTDEWLKKKGLTQEKLDEALTLVGRDLGSIPREDDLQKAIASDEETVRTLELKLAAAQQTDTRGGGPGSTTERYLVNADGTLRRNPDGTPMENPNYVPPREPAGAGPRTFQGQDGNQYVLSEDGTRATLVQGQGAKPVQYQVIEDPVTHDKWTYDPATGRTVTRLFEGKPDITTVTRGGKLLGFNTQTQEQVFSIDLPPDGSTMTDPQGNVYLKNSDGTPGTRLWDGKAQVYTDPKTGRLTRLDPVTGLPDESLGSYDPRTDAQRQLADLEDQLKLQQGQYQQGLNTFTDQLTKDAQEGRISWAQAGQRLLEYQAAHDAQAANLLAQRNAARAQTLATQTGLVYDPSTGEQLLEQGQPKYTETARSQRIGEAFDFTRTAADLQDRIDSGAEATLTGAPGQTQRTLPDIPGNPEEPLGVRALRRLMGWAGVQVDSNGQLTPRLSLPGAGPAGMPGAAPPVTPPVTPPAGPTNAGNGGTVVPPFALPQQAQQQQPAYAAA